LGEGWHGSDAECEGCGAQGGAKSGVHESGL
jgi:hypothetical protein